MSVSASTKLPAEYEGEVLGSRSGPVLRLGSLWVGPILFAIEAAAVVLISIATGIFYHEFALNRPGDIATFVAVGIVTYIDFAIVMAYRGNFTLSNLTSGGRQLREVTVIWSLVCLFLLGVAFLLKIGPELSRGATTSFFVVGWYYLAVSRYCLAKYLVSARQRGAIAEQRVIVLSDTSAIDLSSRLAEFEEGGYDPVKVVSIGQALDVAVEQVVAATRDDPRIGCIFLIVGWDDANRIREIVRKLSIIPLPVQLLPDSKVAALLSSPIVKFRTFWAAELQRGPLSLVERAIKRTLDLFVATGAILLLLPLMLLVALLIKLDSKGPVFFVQTRAGFNNRPFRILKFRTLHTLEDGAVVPQVRRNDPRLTRLGALLRRTSIDELPQLFNVLCGEMSIVGPRPHAAAHNLEFEDLIANYAYRHHVKPGLTGWAQVNGLRGETTVETMQRRVDLDLWYIGNWSVWLDLKIIMWTALIVLRQSSAY
jgi:Undecaprenyl-phosphate glucose phosphotransferase